MDITAYESETVINFNEEGSAATVYTASRRVAKVLQRRGLVPYRVEKTDNEASGWFFELHKSAVLLKPKSAAIRIGGRPQKTDAVSCSDVLDAVLPDESIWVML